MRIFRACRRKFSVPNTEGAFLNDARWHYAGTRVLYCAESVALAVLEQCTNAVTFPEIREDFHYASVDVGGLEIETAPEALFRGNWRDRTQESRAYGMQWIRSSRTPLLKVRSAALSDEWNYVINATHPDFAKVEFSQPCAIPLDARL
jgi:RES domain-containing protein